MIRFVVTNRGRCRPRVLDRRRGGQAGPCHGHGRPDRDAARARTNGRPRGPRRYQGADLELRPARPWRGGLRLSDTGALRAAWCTGLHSRPPARCSLQGPARARRNTAEDRRRRSSGGPGIGLDGNRECRRQSPRSWEARMPRRNATRNAVVAGGSIGGLCAAAALRRDGLRGRGLRARAGRDDQPRRRDRGPGRTCASAAALRRQRRSAFDSVPAAALPRAGRRRWRDRSDAAAVHLLGRGLPDAQEGLAGAPTIRA